MYGFGLVRDDVNKGGSLRRCLRCCGGICGSRGRGGAFRRVRSGLHGRVTERLAKRSRCGQVFGGRLVRRSLVRFVGAGGSNISGIPLVRRFQGFAACFAGFRAGERGVCASRRRSATVTCHLVRRGLPGFVSGVHSFRGLLSARLGSGLRTVCASFRKCLGMDRMGRVFRLTCFGSILARARVSICGTVLNKGALDSKGGVRNLGRCVGLCGRRRGSTELPGLGPLFGRVLDSEGTVS